MKKLVNVYNGYIGYSGQGGGIRYVESLIRLQKTYFDKIYLLSLGSGKAKKKNISGTEVYFYPISTKHNWLIFCFKLFFFLLFNKKIFEGCTFHIHRIYFAPFIKVIKNSKIITTIHTKTFDVFEKKYPYLNFMVSLFIYIERFLINFYIDKITCAGTYAIKLYTIRHKGLKKKLTLLPPFFSFKKSKKKNYFKNEKKKIILVLGRIAKVKRPIEIAQLFISTINNDNYLKKNFKLCYVGYGELFDNLNSFVKKNKAQKNIILLNEVKNKNVNDVINSCHSLILLSSSEVGPFAVKESLATGIPVFSTNVGDVKKLVNEDNGIIIPVIKPEIQIKKFSKFLKKKYNKKKIIKNFSKYLFKDEHILKKNIEKLYK